MGPSLPRLSLLVALLLGFTHSLQFLDYCKDEDTCPHIISISYDQGYEVRQDQETRWMSTPLQGTSAGDYMKARSRLLEYRDQQSKLLGVKIPETWPAVIKVVLKDEDNVEDLEEMRVLWLIPPIISHLPFTETDQVKVETIPNCKIYVRRFGGTPSIEGGKDNAKILMQALVDKHINVNKKTYYGAGYTTYFAFTHYNEIWILDCEN